MKTLSKKKLYECISCKRIMAWKGVCPTCYNAISGKRVSAIDYQYNQTVTYSHPLFFGNLNYCSKCNYHDCKGCAVNTRYYREIKFLPPTYISNPDVFEEVK